MTARQNQAVICGVNYLPTSKVAIRRAALARRQALSSAEAGQCSAQLRDNLFRYFPVAQWQWLHLFLPLWAKREPDTWLIVQRVWAEKLPVRLVAPVVQADGFSLRSYELTPTTPLVKNRWGIPEPPASLATEVTAAQLDAVLVPLLACDQRGHRVGYGGGFYDRFLAQCRPSALFIGLGLFEEAPLPAIADVLPTDIALHACLTPTGVWNF